MLQFMSVIYFIELIITMDKLLGFNSLMTLRKDLLMKKILSHV
jgi:hypothetical protein